MVHPASERIAMLAACRRHLAPGGKIWVTFLGDYADPREPKRTPKTGGFARRVNPDHDVGDLWMRNEAVHVYPTTQALLGEFEAAGLRARNASSAINALTIVALISAATQLSESASLERPQT
jgi:hypothetical protein